MLDEDLQPSDLYWWQNLINNGYLQCATSQSLSTLKKKNTKPKSSYKSGKLLIRGRTHSHGFEKLL